MNENKIARLMRNTGPARVLVPMGLILIVFGIFLLGSSSGKMIPATGRITAVTEGIADENGQSYNVEFTYTADGKEASVLVVKE